MAEFVMRRRIEFVETDMGGIVHFSRYPVFMETAEHRFLETLDWSVDREHEGVRLGWPRVAVRCEYRRPLRFGQTVEIAVRVRRRGRRSVTYGFELRESGETVAEGEMTSVCCVLAVDAPPRSIDIPASLAEKLDAAMEEGS